MNKFKIGDKFIIKEDLKAKCCKAIIPKNTEIEILSYHSFSRKNILMTKYVNVNSVVTIHKVKISSIKK